MIPSLQKPTISNRDTRLRTTFHILVSKCIPPSAWADYIHLFYVVLLLALAVSPLCQVLADEIDFDRDIQPILSDKCYACHGPDEKQRKANEKLRKLTKSNEKPTKRNAKLTKATER